LHGFAGEVPKRKKPISGVREMGLHMSKDGFSTVFYARATHPAGELRHQQCFAVESFMPALMGRKYVGPPGGGQGYRS
jgi:hypothetical protein